MNEYILAIDQGTTSSRAIIFDQQGNNIGSGQADFKQHFPQDGWVEHEPSAIYQSQWIAIQEALVATETSGRQIAGIGITNQRETTLVWDRKTGKPLYNAIVWQDRRTADYCKALREQGHEQLFKDKTGLLIDAYFSATKIKWILDHVGGARQQAEKGELCFGTVDTWLIWKLTRGAVHVTDVSNASRTLVYNIYTLEWDKSLLEILDIPLSMMPEVKSSSEIIGHTAEGLFAKQIPIAGIAGDQQAALFGQLCLKKGMVKNTYGTGCFMLMNTGEAPVTSKHNLLTTIAWKLDGKVTYALEGSVFVGGAAVQWLRDGLGLIDNAAAIEKLAAKVPDTDGVYMVPALTGLGTPHWDPYARGLLIGFSRGTNKAHIARATLEGIAFQVYDLVKAMEADAETTGTELRVDGGASANNLLMQFQSDLLRFPVIRPQQLESTALGAAYLAGLAVGYWGDVKELESQWVEDRIFNPEMKQENTTTKITRWHKAVERSKNWVD